MDPGWLSNAYLLADEEGGTAVYVDSGAPLEPLRKAIAEWVVTPTHVLRTHAHGDHVAHEGELGLPVVTGALQTGGLEVEAIPTPGHSDDMVCFVVNGELVFSGDTLFKDTVGGGDLEQIRRSVMDVYMTMPHERRVLPGHTDETTIGREWEENPFVRVESAGKRRRSSSGRRTTTAKAKPGCDSRTAGTPSSAARGSSGREARGRRRRASRDRRRPGDLLRWRSIR